MAILSTRFISAIPDRSELCKEKDPHLAWGIYTNLQPSPWALSQGTQGRLTCQAAEEREGRLNIWQDLNIHMKSRIPSVRVPRKETQATNPFLLYTVTEVAKFLREQKLYTWNCYWRLTLKQSLHTALNYNLGFTTHKVRVHTTHFFIDKQIISWLNDILNDWIQSQIWFQVWIPISLPLAQPHFLP